MRLKKTVTGVCLALGSMALVPGGALADECVQTAYTTASTLDCTVPDGVKKISVKLWGGGGAGGGSTIGTAPDNARAGAGGGGGGYSTADIEVVPGEDLTLTVGAGGTGATGATGGDGGDSLISRDDDELVVAGGGAGGAANTAGGAPAGGTGGTGNEEDGENGGNGSTGSGVVSGAGGDAGGLDEGGGTGGASVGEFAGNAFGEAGNPYGGGGSGGRSTVPSEDGEARPGGDGADGAIILSWADPAKPDGYKSSVSAYPDEVFANGVSFSTLKVEVNNAYGDGIPGLAKDIECTTNDGYYNERPVIGYFTESYGYEGVYTAPVTSLFTGYFNFECTVAYDNGYGEMPLNVAFNGMQLNDIVENGNGYDNGYDSGIKLGSATIKFVAPVVDEAESEIRANGSLTGATVPLDDIVNITVFVVDTDGVPYANKEVTLVAASASVNLDAVEIIDPPGNVVNTDENGVATFVVYSAVSQTVNFEATFNPTLDIEVTWQPRAIPTLSALGLMALSGLIGLFGWGAARRRRLS